MWRSHAAGVLSENEGEGGCGIVITLGAGDMASGREGGTTNRVVVVERKAVTCHGWDALPDLGGASPRGCQGGI